MHSIPTPNQERPCCPIYLAKKKATFWPIEANLSVPVMTAILVRGLKSDSSVA